MHNCNILMMKLWCILDNKYLIRVKARLNCDVHSIKRWFILNKNTYSDKTSLKLWCTLVEIEIYTRWNCNVLSMILWFMFDINTKLWYLLDENYSLDWTLNWDVHYMNVYMYVYTLYKCLEHTPTSVQNFPTCPLD